VVGAGYGPVELCTSQEGAIAVGADLHARVSKQRDRMMLAIHADCLIDLLSTGSASRMRIPIPSMEEVLALGSAKTGVGI